VGCRSREAETIKARPLDKCLPQTTNDQGNENQGPALAIGGVKRGSDGTEVRLVAYAVDKPAQLDLPLYIMSAGKWLINNSARTYLLDDECREYKLKDKKVSDGQKKVENGRVVLKPGEAFEMTLLFTPLFDDAGGGALIYGDQTVRFAVSP